VIFLRRPEEQPTASVKKFGRTAPKKMPFHYTEASKAPNI